MVPRASVTNYGEKLGTVIAATTKGPSFLPPLYQLQSMTEPLYVHFPWGIFTRQSIRCGKERAICKCLRYFLLHANYTGEMKRRLSPAD